MRKNYIDARICRNCKYSYLEKFRSLVGYVCLLDGKRCNKFKVCDNHKFEFEKDAEMDCVASQERVIRDLAGMNLESWLKKVAESRMKDTATAQ